MNERNLSSRVSAELTRLAARHEAPWNDASSERTRPMSEATERTIDPLAILEDLDARRRTLTKDEREQYVACMVAVCALYPAAKAAYQKWSASLVDLRTSAAVVIAAAKADEEAGQ